MLTLLNNSLWYEAKLNISSQSWNRLTDFRCIFRNLQRSSETVNVKMPTMQLYSKYILISNEFSVTYIKTSKHSRSICFSNDSTLPSAVEYETCFLVHGFCESITVWFQLFLTFTFQCTFMAEKGTGKKKKKKISNLYLSHWRKFL